MQVRIDDSNLIWFLGELRARRIAIQYYEESRVIEATLGHHREFITLEGGPAQHRLYADILASKARTKSFLRERGFAVTKGCLFPKGDHAAARAYVASE